MFCRPIFIRLLPLLHLAIAQSRGGGRGRGGNPGDGDDDDPGDADGGGDSSGDSSGGDDSLPPSAPCDWGARHTAFGLPGIYYNGTLTIRHHITANTAWDEEIEDGPEDEFTNCQNDDRSAKTYEYPALLLIAPIGNDSDTNPFHWQLRAFQPADQVQGPDGTDFLDLEQRWVHIRSSDFVAADQAVSDYFETWPVRNKWRDADASQLDRVTRIYWSTRVSSEGGGVYSSSAEYSREPPAIDGDDYQLPVRAYGKHASQYITLSDVPDAIRNEEAGRLFVYFHGNNSRTRWAETDDGVNFNYGGVAVTNEMGGPDVTETSYARVFPHPDESSDYAYAMFYMGNEKDDV